jgi:hypothetical protein
MIFNSVGMQIEPQSFNDFPNRYRFTDLDPEIPEVLAPALMRMKSTDDGRSWSGSTQNVTMYFTEAVTIDASGWSITVNGVAKTLTYVSGSGTSDAIFQVNTTLHAGDVVKISYDQATGGTVAVTGGIEIKKLASVIQFDELSKRVRFLLCDSRDALVVSQSVKAWIAEYDSGVVENAPQRLFGARTDKATVVTDAAGQFDMQYTGLVPVGGFAYVAVVEIPTTAPGGVAESLLVKDTVV